MLRSIYLQFLPKTSIISGPMQPNNKFLRKGSEHMDPNIDNKNYRAVDMLFNIGRIEGQPARGFDVINLETMERQYFTSGSNELIEQKVKKILGEHAVLRCISRAEDYSLYHVPEGARLLVKTLETAPYKPEYMSILRQRGDFMLRHLQALDPNRFGIRMQDIAIAHNGISAGPDDSYLTIVPPLIDATLNEE